MDIISLEIVHFEHSYYLSKVIYNNKHLKILNISSWYVALVISVFPFIMLKSLVKNNKNSIITNLTVTKNVQKI